MKLKKGFIILSNMMSALWGAICMLYIFSNQSKTVLLAIAPATFLALLMVITAIKIKEN